MLAFARTKARTLDVLAFVYSESELCSRLISGFDPLIHLHLLIIHTYHIVAPYLQIHVWFLQH